MARLTCWASSGSDPARMEVMRFFSSWVKGSTWPGYPFMRAECGSRSRASRNCRLTTAAANKREIPFMDSFLRLISCLGGAKTSGAIMALSFLYGLADAAATISGRILEEHEDKREQDKKYTNRALVHVLHSK